MACVLSKCILLIYLFMSSDNGWHFDLTILVNWDSNVAFSLSYTGLEKKAPVLDAALLRLLSWLRTLAWDILREIQRFNLIVTPDKYLLGSSIRLWILSNIDSLNHVFYTCKAVNNYTKSFWVIYMMIYILFLLLAWFMFIKKLMSYMSVIRSFYIRCMCLHQFFLSFLIVYGFFFLYMWSISLLFIIWLDWIGGVIMGAKHHKHYDIHM